MKKTREELSNEIAVLTASNKSWQDADLMRRTTLSELLGSYEIETGYGSHSKKIIVKDWIGIAFLIGELKADADYACCIQAREDLRREVSDLHQKIYNLEHPDEK